MTDAPQSAPAQPAQDVAAQPSPVVTPRVAEEPEAERVEARAHLLPEEVAAGPSADAELQAQIILEDSDRRTEQPERTRQESAQTPDR